MCLCESVHPDDPICEEWQAAYLVGRKLAKHLIDCKSGIEDNQF